MFTITVILEPNEYYGHYGIDGFIEWAAGDVKDDIPERDRQIAAKESSMARLWYGGETYGELWLRNNAREMQVSMLGPTVVLDQMLKARAAVSAGEAEFQMTHHGGYGVQMRVDVVGDRLRASRTPPWNREGEPDFLETSVDEFVAAVDAYEVWYHTEYLAIASWLLLVEDVQQMRRDAGYPADRL